MLQEKSHGVVFLLCVCITRLVAVNQKKALDLYEEEEKNHGVGTVGLCWIRRGYYTLNEVILRNMFLWAYV